MKKFTFFLLSLGLGILLFFGVIKVVGFEETKQAFSGFAIWQGLVIVGLTLIIIVIETWRWQEILRAQNVEIRFGALWKIYLAARPVKYLAPMLLLGGEVLQGYFLRKNHQVPWAKGISSVTICRILSWTVNLVIIFIGLPLFFFKIGLFPREIGMAAIGALFIFTCAVVFFYFRSFKKKSVIQLLLKRFSPNGRAYFIRNALSRVSEIEHEMFDFFRPERLAMWKALALSFLRVVLMFLRLGLLVVFLQKSITFLPLFCLLNFSILAVMIPIPAHLGSYEAIQAFAFGALGLGAGAGAALAMIIRAAEIIIVLFGVVVLFQLGIKSLKNILLENIEKLTQGQKQDI